MRNVNKEDTFDPNYSLGNHKTHNVIELEENSKMKSCTC